MTSYRIHFRVNRVIRCGHPHALNWTYDPDIVTCKTCLKLLKGEVK